MTSESPPSVIRLSVWPVSLRPMTPTRMARGIETATTSVLRQLPTKARTMSATSVAAIAASRRTPEIAPRTNLDWSNASLSSTPFGAMACRVGQQVARRVDDRQGGRVLLLEDGEVGRALAVDAGHVRLRGVAVVDVRHVAEVDGGAVVAAMGIWLNASAVGGLPLTRTS